jgi:VWFA-related protein
MAGRSLIVVSLFGLTAIGLPAQDAAQRPQTPPTIRSRTTLVPVDVRVVDEKGNPVTDLTRDDFIILEDGRPQEIRVFEKHALTAQPQPPGAPALGAPLLRTAAAAATLSAQNQRMFLFVFGRGRLQWPEKGIDGAIAFVRERLLPQDRVAILAYNRATDFTTDRNKIVRTLERFRKAHDGIEADMKHRFSGLQAAYGSREIPKGIQTQIDEVFKEETTTSRMLPSGRPTDASQLADDTRRTTDAIQRSEILAARDPTAMDAFEREQASMFDMSFDEYARTSAQAGQDLSTLYTGIRYLRFLDGEKHLVFVSEFGLFLPRLENDTSLAALASDARVVIDTLQTGGIDYKQVLPSSGSVSAVNMAASLEGSAMFRTTQARRSLRTFSELTGGTTSVGQTTGKALEQIDRGSRFEYLLGYAPINAAYDGRFRRITVRVKRPGLRVLSRRGYYARPDLLPFDRKQFMTYSRMAAAANLAEEVPDLPVRATVDYVEGAQSLMVNISMGPRGVSMDGTTGKYKGAVDIAIFCGDKKQNLVCSDWQTVDFNLTEGNYQLFQIRGAGYSQRLPLSGAPAFVKVIAYDYTADALGSALVRVK